MWAPTVPHCTNNPVEFMLQTSELKETKLSATPGGNTNIVDKKGLGSRGHVINQLLTLHARQADVSALHTFPKDTSCLKINKTAPWFIWSVCVCVMDAWLQKTRRQTGNVPPLPLNPATVSFISCGPCRWSDLYVPTRILFKHCCHRDDHKKTKCLGRSGENTDLASS